MIAGCKRRLAFAAAILAAVFALVTVGHLGVHSGTAAPDPTCAMCGSSADAVTPAAPPGPDFAVVKVLRAEMRSPSSTFRRLSHPSRGPPALG